MKKISVILLLMFLFVPSLQASAKYRPYMGELKNEVLQTKNVSIMVK